MNRNVPTNDGVDTTQLQQFQCHKVVHAAEIAEINPGDASSQLVLKALAGVLAVIVALVWMEKHEPEVGGYFVVYADGFTSYSPAEAFEAGYTPIE